MLNKVSVIIPCYNEEKTIERVIRSVPKNVLEIVVIDNNCTDKTAEIAKGLGAIVFKEKKQGYGFALQRGFKKARGEIIVTLDGDGQYPAEKIPELIDYFKKNNLDFLNCSRFPLENKKTLPLIRILGNRILSCVASFLFMKKITDSQSGMMIFKKEILKKIKIESGDMPISEELKIKAILNKFKYGEIKIPYYPREGKSKLSIFKHGFKNLFFLLKLRFDFLNRKIITGLSLIFIFFVFSLLASFNLNKEFINITSETNGQNALTVINWQKIGIFKLKGGQYISGILEKESFDFEKIKDKFYTHHPSLFALPTFILYKLFGISELTTRGGPFLIYLLGIIFFYFALVKIFNNYFFPFLTTLIFVILPGTIYYGTTFDMEVFAIPLAQITFSFFVFYYFSRKNYYLYFLFLSVLLGGLTTWFYFCFPVALWLYLLFNKEPTFIKERKKTLIFLPIFSALAFGLNLGHLFLLQGWGGLEDLKNAFERRSQRMPFGHWLAIVYERMKLNFSGFFFFFLLVGFFIYLLSYLKKYKIFLPFLFYPLLNTVFLSQWTTHPFGVILFLPAVAIFSTMTLMFVKDYYQKFFWTFLIFFFITGAYFSFKKLDFFVNQFLILHPNDIQLLKDLKGKVRDYEVCLGQNQMGLYYGGTIMWYLQKNIQFSPDCLEKKDATLAIVFHPQLGDFYQKELNLFIEKGFKPIGCSGFWCILNR